MFWIFACSQCVPQHVCNSALLYPISFVLSSTLVAYTTQAQKNRLIYICVLGLTKFRLIFFVMGQSIMPIARKRKEKEKDKTNFGGPYN